MSLIHWRWLVWNEMHMSSWNILRWLQPRAAGVFYRWRPQRRYTVRLRLEQLEDRLTPSPVTVTSSGDSGPGTLRTVLAAAISGEVIDFAANVRTIDLTSAGLTVGTSVTIQNDLGTGPVTIDGANQFTVFTVNSGVTATLSGLTIQNGNSGANGGGGVFINSGTLTVNDSTFSGNSAAYGGGIENDNGALTVNNSTFSGNSASVSGGGIFNNGGTLSTVSDSTFSDNSASGFGGGIENDAGTLTVSDSTFSGNSAAYYGGGIYEVGILTIEDSTFSDNSAAHSGSAGGGIYMADQDAILKGDIVAGNTNSSTNGADDIAGDPLDQVSSSYNVVGVDDTGSLTNGVKGNQVGVTPAQVALAPLANNGGPTQTFALMPGSFAIGKGQPDPETGVLATDQRGVLRPTTGQSDVGAFQVVATSTTTVSTNSLDLGTTIAGTAGSTQSYTVSGTNLTAAIVVTAPTGIEVSKDNGSTFHSSVSLSPNGNGAVGTTTIDVRISKTAAVGPISGVMITDTSTGATQQDVALTGDVDPVPVPLVVTTADDENDGGTVDTQAGPDGLLSLREAIELAELRGGNQTITFNIPGADSHTITVGSTGLGALPAITNANGLVLTIQGPGQNLLTVSGANDHQVFDVAEGANATITGLTIANGKSSGDGGGIDNEGTLTLTNATLSGNTTGRDGGGLFNDNTATVTNCTFTGNLGLDGADGAGIYNEDSLTVTGSTISGNMAQSGGDGAGIYNEDSLTVTGSTISGNMAQSGGDGGGIYNEDSLTVTGSTISGNMAQSGGDGAGIYSEDLLTLINTTIAGNTANGDGGAIYNEDTLTAINATITDNSARLTGGGIFNENVIHLNNTIVARNDADGGPDVENENVEGTTSNNSLIGNTSDSGVSSGNGNVLNPTTLGLGTLGTNGGPTQTIALLLGSPAIDAGSNALAVDAQGHALTTDQRGTGFPRIVNGTVDIGAYELQASGNLAVSIKHTNTSPTVPGQTVTYTIVVSNAGPSAVRGATLSVILPASLVNATWSVVQTSTGSSATLQRGSGNLSDTVNLAVNGKITFSLTATVVASTRGQVQNTVTITPPANFTDLNATRSATDTDPLTTPVVKFSPWLPDLLLFPSGLPVKNRP